MQPKDSKLTDEELMAIVEESQESEKEPDVKVDEWTDVEKFIQKLQIVDGDEKVPFRLIYYTYQQLNPHKRNYMGYNQFSQRFSWYFEKKRDTHGNNFMIEKGIFDTSKENLLKAWFDRSNKREKQKRRKEKAKQKKQS